MCLNAERIGHLYLCQKNPDINSNNPADIPFCGDLNQQAICAKNNDQAFSDSFFTRTRRHNYPVNNKKVL
jgi:hypothetical protein